jgi:hypothetical protein
MTTEQVADWLGERRPKRPSTATTRTWLIRHYRGEIRRGEGKPGRVPPNLYHLAYVEAAQVAMVKRGAPGRPRVMRSKVTVEQHDGDEAR